MRHPRRRLDRLGDAVAQADHEIDVLQLPRARRHRHEGQHVPVVAEDSRHPLERRGPDRHRLDGRAGRSAAMDQRVEGRLGERLAEHLEALLAAAQAGQPVVHQCHAQPESAAGNGRVEPPGLRSPTFRLRTLASMPASRRKEWAQPTCLRLYASKFTRPREGEAPAERGGDPARREAPAPSFPGTRPLAGRLALPIGNRLLPEFAQVGK